MTKDSPFPDESLSIDPKEYLDYVRKLPCLVCGKAADSHHLCAVGAGRKRKRPKWEDYTIIPLCRVHHSRLHQIGLTLFQNSIQINLVKKAFIILAKWVFHKHKLQEEENGKKRHDSY